MTQNVPDYSAALSNISQLTDLTKLNCELVTAVQNACQVDHSFYIKSLDNFFASSVEPFHQYSQSIADAVAVAANAPFKQYSQCVSDLIAAYPIDISLITKATQIASQIPWGNQQNQIVNVVQTATEVNHEIILQAVESVAPHLEEEQRKTCEEEIIPKLKNPQKEPMTRSDWLAVFSILLALITWLSSLLPDQQQQQQIDQNDVIIQQNETTIQQNEIIIQQNNRIIELDEERNELIKNCTIALNGVAGILESFPDDTDSTREDVNLQQAEPTDDPKEEQGCLDELPNAQDPTGTL